MTRAATGVRAAAVAATLLGLVALVAVASGGPRPEAAGGETNAAGLQDAKDVFFTALLTVYAIAFVALVAYVARQSRVREFVARNPWDFRTLAIFLLFAGSLALVVLRMPDRVEQQLREWGISRLEGNIERLRPSAGDPGAVVEPEFRWWLAAAILALVVAAVVGVLAWSRVGRARLPRLAGPLAGDLAAAVDASLLDLEGEKDPRRAVIAAYAQMERVLAARGAARRAHEVPFEYLARVLRELDVRPAAVLALTELFERARFSRHEIDAAMRDEAAQALAAVRDDLRAAA